jgi:hypothetical protein
MPKSSPRVWPAAGPRSMSPLLPLAMARRCGRASPHTSAAACRCGRPPERPTREAPLESGSATQADPRACDAAVVLLVANATLTGRAGGPASGPLNVAAAEERARISVAGVMAVYRSGAATFIVVTNEA